MIHIHILSGQMAGDIHVVRRFPFRIGRANANSLAMGDSGVWDEHLAVEFHKKEGFVLTTAPGAFAAVNDQQQVRARLRNGDIISFGSAKIQIWLAPPRQQALALREAGAWALILGVTAFQFFLIYRLLR